jgi:hypothetical protein
MLRRSGRLRKKEYQGSGEGEGTAVSERAEVDSVGKYFREAMTP